MSGSADGWTAGAAVFSGRPDPEWEVPAEEAERIVSSWNALPPGRTRAAEHPRLGYRGCWLRAPDGREWRAGGGVVECSGDTRADAGGVLEQAILATAPEDALP